jgi:hypothetical protein
VLSLVKKALQTSFFMLLYKAIQLIQQLFFSTLSDKFLGLTQSQIDSVVKKPCKADGPLQTV